MTIRWSVPCSADLVAEIVSTSQADGDFRVPASGSSAGPALIAARQQICQEPWTWFHQIHGSTVHEVCHPGEFAGLEADGAFTVTVGCPIAVNTADCAPVVLVSSRGVAVVHAGWRGAKAGIVEAAGERLLSRGGDPVAALLGPCIGPDSYEFGESDLEELVALYGPEVASSTNQGRPALNMVALVGAACENAGWNRPAASACTSDPAFFSHRVREDAGRQATVAWLRPADTPSPRRTYDDNR